MNLLYLCDEYPPGRHGGIGSAVQFLAREMVNQGHKVVVAGLYDWGYGQEDKENDNGVLIYRFRRGLASKFFEKRDSIVTRFVLKLLYILGILHWDIERSLHKYQAFLEQLIKEHEIELIEMPDFQDYVSFCRTYLPFPKLSAPVIVKIHGSVTYFLIENNKPVPQSIKETEHDILEKAIAVVSVSKYAADKTAEYLDYHNKIDVLPNGIDINEMPANTEKIPYRVVFSGSLVEKKGIYQLLEAWNVVSEKLPKAELHIFGKGPVHKLKRILTKKAADTVFFEGHVSRKELFRQLAIAPVAIFPSLNETFGLAPVEAMACNTATIFTTRTSGPEIIDDRVSGLLVDPYKINDITEAVVSLLTDSKLCEQLARNGRKKVMEQFDMNIIVQKHIAYYKGVLNNE
jgi:glycosyltransferase involved in cell wall biosynthesis